ncbi:hypothetical protein FK220_016760 [Flavobacteriaceae bacterium TP-CH-4]|uniref:Holin-X, holin superfamily III n=1 Tax=Pelagihabitans pacificus TaxID=2696054 RepID=A0A967E7U9_9FLAO|nr:hypothetical protein [Pelagihabitans pacificus]NHF61005.1 hypothetical protein [Pelagihabitans pacificus]
MGVFDSLESTSKDAFASGEHFFESSKKYYELRIFKQLAITTTSLVKIVLVGSFCLLGLLFGTVALAIYLGDYFGSLVQGFLTTGVILFCIAIIILLLRKKMDKKIIRKLSETFFDEP